MEGSLKKLLFFGTFFIIADIRLQAGYYIHQYILITHLKMGWTEAREYCRAEYSDLATIPNSKAYDAIHEMTSDWEEPFWIGLYDGINSWQWSLAGKHFYQEKGKNYRQWDEDQPDNAGADEHCVSMMDDGFWRDNSCTRVKMPLVCFRDNAKDQYVLVTEPKSWIEAQSYCRQHYTDLVSVRTQTENREVRNQLQGDAAVQEAWIGLHRDSWRWSDGSSSSFRQWLWNEPNNENYTEACVYMQNGEWADWNCDTSHHMLCQNITEVTSPPLTGLTPKVELKRTTVKMRLQTTSDLKDPNISQKVLQQLEAAFHSQGLTVKLRWRIVRQEPQPPTKTDECGKAIQKNPKLNFLP